jgi:translocation protein SEC62
MAEKRKNKGKKGQGDSKLDEDKPSKLEYDVAKYLRNNLPPKKTTLLGHKVEYFISAKAIDSLLDSKWATKAKTEQEAVFTTRDSVVEFLEQMLRHKFFHRARKIIVKSEPKKKKGDQEESAAEEAADKKKDKVKKDKKEKDGANSDDKDTDAKDKDAVVEKKQKEKKKVKLDMHLDQVYVDGSEPFVWIYDPIPLKAWLIGLGLMFGAVAICLFPLWPRIVRNYVYYLSIAAAGFLFFIIALAVLRFIVFCLVWAITFGKHHFWLLPNLTEDVGFFASFWPLYQHDYMGESQQNNMSSFLSSS